MLSYYILEYMTSAGKRSGTTLPSGAPSLSVIIPAYNEAKRIEKTLDAVHAFLQSEVPSYEILVIDDGSEDSTAALVQKKCETIPHLRLIKALVNGGKGRAVVRGMLDARGEVRLFMDADNSTPIETWKSMAPYFETFDKNAASIHHRADIVIGSRRVKGATIAVHQPFYRTFLGHLFRILTRTILPLDIADTQNGFKACTAAVAEDLFPRLTTMGWAFDVEFLALARMHEYRIEEVPVTWHNDNDSRMNLSGMWHMLVDIVRIRLSLINFS